MVKVRSYAKAIAVVAVVIFSCFALYVGLSAFFYIVGTIAGLAGILPDAVASLIPLVTLALSVLTSAALGKWLWSRWSQAS